MIKGLIITHGDLGDSLVTVTETILEEKINIDSFSFDWAEDGTDTLARINNYLKQNKDHDIIIFTDMFGGSPTNVCLKFHRENLEIITGVNLPGLLKFITYRDKNMDFHEIVRIVKQGAIEGVNIISEYLGEKKK